ncbi:hypothetical protein AN218_30405 [Streptomyces nanshensis]|uniref:Uncharacterized protein n=1 Tax=Streptomyces nanshensis TaxID=518642 RepID=A0A1E7KRE6_9ACTN|nr:hypothetical protein AN218_30405 [Streptomyces nanshensis]
MPKPSSGSAGAAPVTGAASADAAGSGGHGQVPGAGADFGTGTGPDSDSDSDPGPDSDADAGSDSGPAIPEQPRLTDKGLPKRTPHHVEPRTGGPDKPRNHSANADEMRRRLGGFQRGAEHGRRDAAAETGADERETGQRGTQSDGGTAEEART